MTTTGQTLTKFQSTPPARGATLCLYRELRWFGVSIHTPREGGDFDKDLRCKDFQYVSIHTPREGGDARLDHLIYVRLTVSIHTPREGGDDRYRNFSAGRKQVSIHTPREGGDVYR